MMGNDGAASLHCVAIRVAGLALDGSTPAGNPLYVTDSLIKIDFNPDIEAGPETVTRNAAGNLCIIYKLPDIVKRLTASIQICTPDPELEAILSGGTTYVSGAGPDAQVMGYQYPKMGVDPVPNGLSIEAWTHAVVGDHIDPSLPYMHWVFPLLHNVVKANRTIDNTPMDSTFNGYFLQNANWGNGPANDWPWDSSSVAQWTREASFPAPQLGAQLITAQV